MSEERGKTPLYDVYGADPANGAMFVVGPFKDKNSAAPVKAHHPWLSDPYIFTYQEPYKEAEGVERLADGVTTLRLRLDHMLMRGRMVLSEIIQESNA